MIGLFLFIYLATIAAVFLWFTYKIKKVSEYTHRVFEGERALLIHNAFKGVFRGLMENIGMAAAELQEKVRSADDEKNRLLSILESMAEGVAVIDPAQKIVLVNSALGRAFGVSKKETQGRFFWEIFRDPKINEMITQGLDEKGFVRKEHTTLLFESVFEIRISPVFSGEEFLGVVAVFQDISKLKELERVRTEFVANVSHELKTPLTSIMGFVETLKEGAVEDAAQRVRFLQIIDEHSKKLHALIDELLLLSKIESAQGVIQKEPVEVESLLKKVLELFEEGLKTQKIKAHLKITPKPFWVEGDRLLLERAFSNLVSNAVKYNKPNGEILIEASCGPKSADISFADTGIGIPESDLGRIFERFYRVDRSRARESGGTGLGLSIAKHIVERHDGTIEVKSRLGQGSSFLVRLPVALGK